MFKRHNLIDKLFRKEDAQQLKRTRNLRLIPDFENRRGGKVAYAEWAHVIGIFQTLMYQNLKARQGSQILDIGCGTGLLGIAAEPLVQEGGKYTGIDVLKKHIDYCQSQFKASNYQFIHFDVANQMYVRNQKSELHPWTIEDQSQDMVTALSVWTHLKEKDARFYFKEVARVLKPGGRAIISMFLLDELYQASLPKRENALGRYHLTPQKNWVFDTPAYGSKNWFSPGWIKVPEKAMGIKDTGLQLLLEESALKKLNYHPGNWKETPGLYFQDILIFEKP